jgi:hypothetical protein
VHKIGIAFSSALSPDQVREQYVNPLRELLEAKQAGIYSNYLRQVDPDGDQASEHLLVFEIQDFKAGLRLLRVELERLGLPGEVQLQNLNPSTPGY